MVKSRPTTKTLRRLAIGLLLLCGLSELAAAGQGLVFRVTRDGYSDSFLVGTMHSEDPRVTGLMAQFAPLIERVDSVALELLPDAVTLLAVGAASLLPADRRLSAIIGADRFAALTDAAARLDIPIEVLDRLRPWAAAVTLGMPSGDSGRVLDAEIYLHALRLGRRTLGLESAAEQLAVFQDMPAQLQIELLDEMIKNAEHLPTQLEDLTSAFLSGDLALLDRVAREQYADMPPDMLHWFESALLDERNARMLDRLDPLLREGGVMVAVGALHLGGANGLVQGLRQRGFTVQRWPRKP